MLGSLLRLRDFYHFEKFHPIGYQYAWSDFKLKRCIMCESERLKFFVQTKKDLKDPLLFDLQEDN